MKWICYVYEVDERIQSRFTSHTMSWCHYFYPVHDLDHQDQLAPEPDVLAGFVMPVTDERDVRWCQGKVKEVYEKKNAVKVCWNPIPDCAGWETSQETVQKLPRSKWNKNVDGAWRMDLSIELYDTSDKEITKTKGMELKICDGDDEQQ